MKLSDFISKLKLAHDVPNYYCNKFPKNCGYYDGSRFSFDCWNLVKAILGGWTDNRTVGYYVSPKNFPTGDCDGYHLLMQCTNRSRDFSQLKQAGTYLYISDRGHEHAGVYVGDFVVDGYTFNVVECTSDWASKVQYTYVNEKGERFLYKGGLKGRSWTDYGLLPWVEYNETIQPVKNNPKTSTSCETNFGIDISRWQKGFNLKDAWNEGFTHCIIKAGGADGSYYKDSQFENFYTQARAGAWKIGAYYFGCAFSTADAVKEANYFIEYLKGKAIKHVYYDVEGNMLNQGYQHLTDIIKTFCQTMVNAGYICGVYTSESHFKSRFDKSQVSKFPFWVAKYSKNPPSFGCECWQYGGSVNYVRSPKINGTTIDQDFFYTLWGDEIQIAKEPVVVPTVAKKSVDQLAIEVLAGMWGNNPIRAIRLNASGYDAKQVQARVDEIANQRKQTKKTHVVIHNETLSSIAKRYNTTVDALVKANNIPNKNKIYVGQEIVIV